MDQIKEEKIKQLVNASPILTSAERSEWLALLGLMNDKQVNELEKILTGFEETSAPKPQPKPQAPVKPLQQPERKKEEQPQTPGSSTHFGYGFSHIMNFPDVEDKKKKQQAEPAKKESKFGANLQNIINEKELPTSKEGFPLELTAPGAAKPAQSKKVIKYEVVKHEEKKPPVPPMPPKEKPKPKPAVSPVVLSAKPKEPEHKKAPVSSPQDKFTPGVSLPRMTSNINAFSAKDNKIKLPETPIIEEGKSKAAGSLKNPSELSLGLFKEAGIEGILKQLAGLLKYQEYHELIFNLEKSPLYKMYMNTGSKILNEQIDFEDLEKMKSPGALKEQEYLSKKEFEDFVDLLRKIQAG